MYCLEKGHIAAEEYREGAPKIRNNTFRVILSGRLGNQLFIYFAGLVCARKTGSELELLDFSRELPRSSSALENFTINALVRSPTFLERRKRSLAQQLERLQVSGITTLTGHYVSKRIGFDSQVFRLGPRMMVEGYFQTHYYFQMLSPEDKALWLRTPGVEFEKLKDEALKEPPLMVHVRRGDYLHKQTSQNFGVLSDQYFRDAIEISNQKHKRQIWFFSDSPELIKDLASSYKDSRIVASLTPAESLSLMSMSRFLITSNSSMSFWSGMLASSPTTVYAPSKWFIAHPQFDPCPPSWIRLAPQWQL
jgi:hypothetical protein